MIGKKLAEANLFFCSTQLAYANLCADVKQAGDLMNLSTAVEGKEYIIDRIETDDEELNSFLFSLGCYSGEPITVVSRRRGSCVVAVKDGRYCVDSLLAASIFVC